MDGAQPSGPDNVETWDCAGPRDSIDFGDGGGIDFGDSAAGGIDFGAGGSGGIDFGDGGGIDFSDTGIDFGNGAGGHRRDR